MTYTPETPTVEIPAYQDSGLPAEKRVEDLLTRMTLQEKAGLMFHQMVEIGEGGDLAGASTEYALPPTAELILKKQINHFNVLGSSDPKTRSQSAMPLLRARRMWTREMSRQRVRKQPLWPARPP